MIPFVASIGIQRPNRRGFRLWIPLVIVWLLLLPIAILLLPFIFAACFLARLSPFQTIATFWGLLVSLGGTNVEIDNPDGSFSIHLF